MSSDYTYETLYRIYDDSTGGYVELAPWSEEGLWVLRDSRDPEEDRIVLNRQQIRWLYGLLSEILEGTSELRPTS